MGVSLIPIFNHNSLKNILNILNNMVHIIYRVSVFNILNILNNMVHIIYRVSVFLKIKKNFSN